MRADNSDHTFLSGGGEMGRLVREKDWRDTPVGTPDTWPQSLRTTLSIILNSKFPMFLWWGPQLTCFYNDAYRPSLGINGKHPAILGQAADIAWPEIWTVIKPLIDNVLSGGEATWSEDQLIPIFRNGQMEDVYWTFSYSPVNDESGKPAGVFVTCYESTEKVITLSKIKERESQLSFAIDAAEMGTWDLDPVTNRFVGNERIKEWFGLAADDEIELADAIHNIHEEDRERVATAIGKAVAEGSDGNYQIEYRINDPVNSIERIVLAKGKALFDDNGIATRFSGTLEDITERRKIVKQAQDTERRFRNTVNQAPVGITIFRGPEFIVEMANETYLLLVDKKEAEFIGRSLFDSLPEVKEAVSPLLNNVYTTGNSYYGTDFPVTIHRYGKAEETYFSFVYQALRDGNGDISGIIVVATEVTSSVKARHALTESEKQFRNLVMQSPIPMTIFRGPEYIIEMANRTMYDNIWQRKEADVRGKKALEVFPELNDQKYPALLKQVYDTGVTYREIESVAYVQGETKLNKYYLDFEYAPLFETDGSVSGIIITIHDVTEKVEARTQLEENEDRLNIIIKASELGTFELNLQTDETTYSERYLEIFGYDSESRPEHGQLLTNLHPDDREIRNRAFEESMRTGVIQFEVRIQWKDASVHWIETKGKVFYDDNHQPLKLIGTVRDITYEKRRQQELFESEQNFRSLADSMETQVKERTSELELKNRELEKMNTELQSFAYVSSHDLQEPLRKIQTFASRIIAKEKETLSETAKDYFIRIQQAANRMQTLIEDLLSYSRTNTTDRVFKKMNLGTIVEQVRNDSREMLDEKQAVIELGDMCDVTIIPFQFSQLFHNLIGNSVKFAKPGIPPVIRITSTLTDTMKENIKGLAPGKKYCHIQFTDNGIGFDPQYSNRIFEVFQRLHGKDEYTGTGIGLAIVKKIVENHNGMITATGKPNGGARFDIYVPFN